jgi:hypothetical protein
MLSSTLQFQTFEQLLDLFAEQTIAAEWARVNENYNEEYRNNILSELCEVRAELISRSDGS